jgi:hypothetical protein
MRTAAMIQRVRTVVLAIGFLWVLDRAAARPGPGRSHRGSAPRRSHCLATATLLASMLMFGMPPQSAHAGVPGPIAQGPISSDTVVRVSSSGLEPGWLRGRVVLDARRCWMVQLDRATQDGYTLLALSFVAAVEVANGAGWTPLALQPVIDAQPAECLESGAD